MFMVAEFGDKEYSCVTYPVDRVVTDGKTSIKPITSITSVGKEEQHMPKEYKETTLKEPTIIVSFPDPGMVGSITVNYIIERLHMHEIAFVESEFIIPGIIYIGGKLRHPFRIYSNNDGSICIIICEIPIITTGIYSVLNTTIKWALRYKAKEVIVLGGLAIDGIPSPDRKTLILSSGNVKVAYMDGGSQRIKESDNNFMIFMEGISAGLLASCLSNGIKCRGIFIPAPNSIPDPEGAAMLIEAINSLRHHLLNIDVRPLREKGEIVRKQMEDLIKVMLAQQQQQQDQLGTGRQRMYT
jgi:uncharacterized protein